jgi:hypothetical protein
LKTVALLKALIKKYPPIGIQPQMNNAIQLKNSINSGWKDLKKQLLILDKDLQATKKQIDLFF